jgi:hypothetical protein
MLPITTTTTSRSPSDLESEDVLMQYYFELKQKDNT